jgi:hypothetical protein
MLTYGVRQAPDFPPLYNFEQVEVAIQTLAQQKGLKWLTAKERQEENKGPRPRIDSILKDTPFSKPPHFVIDCNGADRINGWEGLLILTLITKPDYVFHQLWRSQAKAFAATIQDQLGDYQNLALLPYHSIARCREKSNDPQIVPQDGYMASKLEYEIIFNIYPQAFPGGLLSA